jgi:hypothetical protein
MSQRHNKHGQWLHPKCIKCGRKGKVTKEDLCFMCYKDKFGKVSNEFVEENKERGK